MIPNVRGRAALNLKHPDARGLVFAVPCNEGGGLQLRAYGKHSFPLTAQGAGVLNTDWDKYRFGTGWLARVVVSGCIGDTFTVGGMISMSALIKPVALSGGFLHQFFRCSSAGIQLDGTTGLWGIGDQTGATGSTYGAAATLGTMYQVGFSLVSATSGFFYINGQKFALTSFPTMASNPTKISEGTAGSRAANGSISDIRVWDRVMPDSAFRRHYVEGPSKFYVNGVVRNLRSTFFNAGRFFPFMHPSLAS